MASRLNERDLELIQTNQSIDLTAKEYSYIGGEFTKNSNDYVDFDYIDYSVKNQELAEKTK